MNRVATIGFFDGVHKGHRFLFEQLHQVADERQLSPLIITFDAHPRASLQHDYIPQLITSIEQRKALLEQNAQVLILPFEQIQPLTAEQFMLFLLEQYQVTTIVMGYDHRFGSDRMPHIQDYCRVAQKIGVEVIRQKEFVDGELHISSTEIRNALVNGNIILANELLGWNYSLTGVVVKGKEIGRTIGFPTANLSLEHDGKIIPKNGVYAVKASSDLFDSTMGILNIGNNPTLGTNPRTIELHIPHFSGDLYGKTITIHFLRFLREEKCFESISELKAQIEQDLILAAWVVPEEA